MVGQIQVDPSEVQAMGGQVSGESGPLAAAAAALQGVSASSAGFSTGGTVTGFFAGVG
jgi:uncharacterized protein YukE